MLKAVPGGTTIIISGPASATVLEGTVAVLGGNLPVDEKLVIRRGKTLPLEAEEAAVLDLVLGVDATVEEVDGSTIPASWRTAAGEALARPKPCTVLVLGGVDSGKTSFSTYLINTALKSQGKPAIVDADLGQSDVGPPTSIGLSVISKPVADLFAVKPAAVSFMGRTSAHGISSRVVAGLTSILTRVPEGAVDLTVINTDGWIEGDDAHAYKGALIRKVDPDLVVGLQWAGELDALLDAVADAGFPLLRAAPSTAVKRRTREDRRELRAQSYKKHLGTPTLRSLHLNWIALEDTPLGQGAPVDLQRVQAIESALQRQIVYCEESSRSLYLVVRATDRVNDAPVEMTESLFHKDVYLVKEGEEEGLLVGLLNNARDFLGLGLIAKLDYANRTLKIQTAYKDTVNIVQFGQVYLNEVGEELGVTTAFSIKEPAASP
jgi:polynucleotide 5'-hydroxyl-kinase GRC3/NOL9